MDNPNFDVDSHAKTFENPKAWKLRREFMLAHKDTINEDRLCALAMCYINIEIDHCV